MEEILLVGTSSLTWLGRALIRQARKAEANQRMVAIPELVLVPPPLSQGRVDVAQQRLIEAAIGADMAEEVIARNKFQAALEGLDIQTQVADAAMTNFLVYIALADAPLPPAGARAAAPIPPPQKKRTIAADDEDQGEDESDDVEDELSADDGEGDNGVPQRQKEQVMQVATTRSPRRFEALVAFSRQPQPPSQALHPTLTRASVCSCLCPCSCFRR